LRIQKKYIIEEIVRQVGHLAELYEDALSENIQFCYYYTTVMIVIIKITIITVAVSLLLLLLLLQM